MKSLFVMLSKLMGLYIFLSSIVMLAQQLRYFTDWPWFLFAYIAVLFGCTWVLLFRSENIAQFLKIEGEDIPEAFKGNDFLRIGIILLGIHLFVLGLPSLITVIAQLFGFSKNMPSYHFHFIFDGLPTLIKLALGAFLVLYPAKVMALANWGDRRVGELTDNIGRTDI